MGVQGAAAVLATTEGTIDAPETSRTFGRWEQIEEKYRKPNSICPSKEQVGILRNRAVAPPTPKGKVQRGQWAMR